MSPHPEVARGVALLDEMDPGWAAYVDPWRVVLSSPTRCVLAQIGRNRYQSGLVFMIRRIGVSGRGGMDRHGFMPSVGATRAWRKAIRAHRRAERRLEKATVATRRNWTTAA